MMPIEPTKENHIMDYKCKRSRLSSSFGIEVDLPRFDSKKKNKKTHGDDARWETACEQYGSWLPLVRQPPPKKRHSSHAIFYIWCRRGSVDSKPLQINNKRQQQRRRRTCREHGGKNMGSSPGRPGSPFSSHGAPPRWTALSRLASSATREKEEKKHDGNSK